MSISAVAHETGETQLRVPVLRRLEIVFPAVHLVPAVAQTDLVDLVPAPGVRFGKRNVGSRVAVDRGLGEYVAGEGPVP
jgi:hypothetical protein